MFSTAVKIPSQCESVTIERRIQLVHNFHVIEAKELGDMRVVREGNKLTLQRLPQNHGSHDELQPFDLPVE